MRAQGKYINKNYHGEKVHTAKLTAYDVRLIDALLEDENMSMGKIAQKFNVSRNAIWDIAHGNTWKQVTGVGL
jgi:predicted DNA-binding protein YlxM (UPF0122 family)